MRRKGRLSAEAVVARRVARRASAGLPLPGTSRSPSGFAAFVPPPGGPAALDPFYPSSYPPFGSALHSAAIQSIFGGRSRRMSFFSRKKHTQQQASTSVVAASPASAALAQVQQPLAGQQQPQKQLQKESSYDRCVSGSPPIAFHASPSLPSAQWTSV